MRLSLIVPAHNEERRIGPMLEAYMPFLAAHYGNDVEVIVVVNGSTDDTAGVVGFHASRFPQLRCLVEPRGIGKGGALITGFRQAQGELIGFVDADGATPPEAFQELVDRIGNADMAVASRWSAGATVTPRQPLSRRIASRVFNLLTRFLFGLRLSDTQCGAKLMKRQALIPILDGLGITRWAFDVDLLFQLKRAGRSIIEIPTTWRDVSGSKIQIAAASIEMLAAIIRLRLMHSPFLWVVRLYEAVVHPLIHPHGLQSDHLYGHSILLLSCAQVANIGSLLFQVAMMRMLDAVEYGTLAAMLGLYAAVITPLTALPWAVAHFVAGLLKDGRTHDASGLVTAVSRDICRGSAVAFILFLLLSSTLMGYFNLDDQLPLFLVLASVTASVFGSLSMGALQGAQKFLWIAGIGVAWSFSRILLASLGVELVGGATGALLGQAASMVVIAAAAHLGLRRVMGRVRSSPERPPGFYLYCAQYAGASIGYALLMNADLLLVKHFFPAEDAGRYASVAMVGRMILFLPQPIVIAMFPKVVSIGKTSPADWHTLSKALVLASLMISVLALICSMFPDSILLALTGNHSPDLIPLVPLMAWGSCPLSLTFFIMNFELAQRRFAVAIPLLVCAAGYITCLIRWHGTLQQVALVLVGAACAAFLTSLGCLFWQRRGSALV